jgi:hypothetical protein
VDSEYQNNLLKKKFFYSLVFLPITTVWAFARFLFLNLENSKSSMGRYNNYMPK